MKNIKLISIDPKKCVNCHVCISVCPVKYCLIDSNHVKVNDDLCIGCGRCYNACPHSAITIIDDTAAFLNSVNQGEKNIIIVSPALIVSFKDQYKKLLTWLREAFVVLGVFDESIGAEISALLYHKYFNESGRLPIIYQYCPTVVEFIKINYPNLIDYLSPIQSSTIITAKLIRAVFNYSGNITYLGPCISKRKEFNDTDTNNIIQYNVTFDSLIKYINNNNINLENYEISDFDFIPAERASVFCRPKGFSNIIKRFDNKIKVSNIEGESIYNFYLKEISNLIESYNKFLPDLLDILNCDGGCFRGPASHNELMIEEEKFILNEKEEESIGKFKNKTYAHKVFENLLKDNKNLIFERTYLSESASPVNIMSNNNLKDIYRLLNMYESRDFLNCRSCGFKTCQDFATSMFISINDKKNCRFHIEKLFNTYTSNNNSSFKEIISKSSNIEKSLDNINKMMQKLLTALSVLKDQLKNINELNQNLNNNADLFEPIIIAISEISEQINLLSLNASIEASRTGELGKGFSVVSMEIRKLADKTKNETSKVNPILQNIINDLKNINNTLINVNSENTNFNEIGINLNTIINVLTNDLNNLFVSLNNINLEI